DSPSYSQIRAEEHWPEAGVSSNRKRAVVVVCVEVDVSSRLDVEGETAARRDDRRYVKIGERLREEPTVAGAVWTFEDRRKRQPVAHVERRESTISASVGRVLRSLFEVDVVGVTDRFAVSVRPDHLVIAVEAFVHRHG